MPKKQTTARAPHLRLGEYHPHYGGHYAGLVRGANGGPDHHLFVSPKALGEASSMEWGGYGHVVTGADDAHDGAANTAALANDANPHPAAKFCRDLAIDGFTDWYLPSREELRLCFTNCREVFDHDWYWSSTQYAGSASYAWYQDFYDGSQNGNDKEWKGRVRAVRRLVVL